MKVCGVGEGGLPLYAVLSADRSRYYIVVPRLFCSCPDYFFSVVSRKTKEMCYHMLAVEIGLREGLVEEECWTSERLFKELLRSLGARA